MRPPEPPNRRAAATALGAAATGAAAPGAAATSAAIPGAAATTAATLGAAATVAAAPRAAATVAAAPGAAAFAAAAPAAAATAATAPGAAATTAPAPGAATPAATAELLLYSGSGIAVAAVIRLPFSPLGVCHLCEPPDPGIQSAALGVGEAATLGASTSAALGAGESALSGTTLAQALHTFTLDLGASRSFFRDRTTLTPLSRPVAVSLADPSGGPVLASFSTVLPYPAAPFGTLSSPYLPSFSTNLVSGADLRDRGVDLFTPASQQETHCTSARTGRHLATFTRRPGSNLYTLTTESPPTAESGQVAVSSQVFPGLSLPYLRGLPLPASLASRGDSAPPLTPPSFLR
ncbi:unnamed protein product [Closterium sp. NIES-65]|nr:unnamed protein product [Closterium sp. NIES-65]